MNDAESGFFAGGSELTVVEPDGAGSEGVNVDPKDIVGSGLMGEDKVGALRLFEMVDL